MTCHLFHLRQTDSVRHHRRRCGPMHKHDGRSQSHCGGILDLDEIDTEWPLTLNDRCRRRVPPPHHRNYNHIYINKWMEQKTRSRLIEHREPSRAGPDRAEEKSVSLAHELQFSFFSQFFCPWINRNRRTVRNSTDEEHNRLTTDAFHFVRLRTLTFQLFFFLFFFCLFFSFHSSCWFAFIAIGTFCIVYFLYERSSWENSWDSTFR